MQNSVFTVVLLPLALAIVMLGMGLSLVPEDFRRITRYPRAVAVGTGSGVGIGQPPHTIDSRRVHTAQAAWSTFTARHR